MTATVKWLAQFHAKWRGFRCLLQVTVAFAGLTCYAVADTNSVTRDQLLAHAQEVFATALKAYEIESTNNVVAWKFAKAAFDRGEFSTNDTERAAIAVQGISACRKLIQRDAKCAQGYYYLGLN